MAREMVKLGFWFECKDIIFMSIESKENENMKEFEELTVAWWPEQEQEQEQHTHS